MKLNLTFEMCGSPGNFAGSARLAAGRNLSCCPFCRGTNVEAVNTWTPYYWVECSDCGAEGPRSRSPRQASFETEASAKRAHRRAITEAVQLWEDRL